MHLPQLCNSSCAVLSFSGIEGVLKKQHAGGTLTLFSSLVINIFTCQMTTGVEHEASTE